MTHLLTGDLSQLLQGTASVLDGRALSNVLWSLGTPTSHNIT